jgi:hypothetical protein
VIADPIRTRARGYFCKKDETFKEDEMRKFGKKFLAILACGLFLTSIVGIIIADERYQSISVYSFTQGGSECATFTVNEPPGTPWAWSIVHHQTCSPALQLHDDTANEYVLNFAELPTDQGGSLTNRMIRGHVYTLRTSRGLMMPPGDATCTVYTGDYQQSSPPPGP